jgi:isocitrate lyase
VHKRFPDARFAFNYSSSFKWFNEQAPMTFAELGNLGVRFLFVTLGAQHATAHGFSVLLQAMANGQEKGYIELQQKEWEHGVDFPSKSHHFFSGVPYHHLVGKMYSAARLGQEFCEHLEDEKVV